MPRSRKHTAGYAALAVADTVLAGRSHRRDRVAARRARRMRFLTKPLLMPVLAATTHAATPARTDLLRNATLAAQAWSWGGDVALLGKGERWFLTGVGSFFAAHVAYVTGFASASDRTGDRDSSGAKAAAAVWVVLAPTMSALAGRKDPAMRLPIAAYATVLSTMFATSTLLDTSIPRSARRRITAGTALFLLSDAILGLQEFALQGRSSAMETAVMAGYTTGQWLIADGVAHAR